MQQKVNSHCDEGDALQMYGQLDAGMVTTDVYDPTLLPGLYQPYYQLQLVAFDTHARPQPCVVQA